LLPTKSKKTVVADIRNKEAMDRVLDSINPK
jgi:hypothetical protein